MPNLDDEQDLGAEQPELENPTLADEEEEEPEYLTKAEFEQAMTAREQDILRRAQSMTDKAESRVTRRFNELTAGNVRALEVAKQAGLSGDQLKDYESRLRSDAMQRALGESGQPLGPDASQQPPVGQEQGVDPQAITQQGLQLMQQGGLQPGDPELALIATNGSPEDFFVTIRAAAGAKQLRLQSTPGNGQPPTPGQPPKPARVPGLGPTGRRAPKGEEWKKSNNVDELLDYEWKQLGGQGS